MSEWTFDKLGRVNLHDSIICSHLAFRCLEKERLARAAAEGEAREAWRAANSSSNALEDQSSVIRGLQRQIEEIKATHLAQVRLNTIFIIPCFYSLKPSHPVLKTVAFLICCLSYQKPRHQIMARETISPPQNSSISLYVYDSLPSLLMPHHPPDTNPRGPGKEPAGGCSGLLSGHAQDRTGEAPAPADQAEQNQCAV